MKTDKEWIVQYYATESDMRIHDGSFVRAIQLDAIRHGMTLAAELIDNPSCNRPAQKILTARDNFQLP